MPRHRRSTDEDSLAEVKKAKMTHDDKAGNSASSNDLALTAFTESFFFILFIQPDDEIFQIAYDKIFSRRLREHVNNHPLGFNGFKKTVEHIRATITNRRQVSQSVLIAPPDPSGETTTVGHTAKVSGVRDGKEVILSVLAVGTVFVLDNGDQQLAIENLVLRTDEA